MDSQVVKTLEGIRLPTGVELKTFLCCDHCCIVRDIPCETPDSHYSPCNESDIFYPLDKCRRGNTVANVPIRDLDPKAPKGPYQQPQSLKERQQ